jgi:N-acetyl-anhydromuramyl-L-alanine amidase AmpD
MKMKMNLKITALALALVLALSLLCACNEGGAEGVTSADGTSAPEASAPETTVAETTVAETTVAETTTPETTAPEIEVEQLFGVVSTDVLNVRSGAGTKFDVVGTLTRGDSVEIVGTSGGWHRIKHGEGEAYVSTDYIELRYTVDASKHVIYDGAVHDLFPIAKSYSFKREMEIEYVMLHFSSAILIDWNDPYNIDLIRDIFIDGGVDAHYLIGRDGTVYCNVPEDRGAYHAGRGTFGDVVDNMNSRSVGIEIAAIGSVGDMSKYMTAAQYATIPAENIGYTDAQYEALGALVADICERYGISVDREHIMGHDEYNPKKNDPGELFDWDRLIAEVKERK